MDEHKPVLLDEVLELLRPTESGIYVDCTFGRGGYTAGILQNLGPQGRVIALDADSQAIGFGRDRFSDEKRLTLMQERFAGLAQVLAQQSLSGRVDGVVFDLGVSSPQLDDVSRGFSFRQDGPLDMRMDPQAGISAAEWLNTAEEKEIEQVIKRLGEERFARQIAKKIMAQRNARPLRTTRELEEIVLAALPEKEKRGRKIHPATKTFQAIRIFLNDELAQVEAGVAAALEGVARGGRVLVVSFHSLEDRIVKRLFRRAVQGERLPDKLPLRADEFKQAFEYLCGVVTPSAEELEHNPRSRSAKLRAVRRLV